MHHYLVFLAGFVLSFMMIWLECDHSISFYNDYLQEVSIAKVAFGVLVWMTMLFVSQILPSVLLLALGYNSPFIC